MAVRAVLDKDKNSFGSCCVYPAGLCSDQEEGDCEAVE